MFESIRTLGAESSSIRDRAGSAERLSSRGWIPGASPVGGGSRSSRRSAADASAAGVLRTRAGAQFGRPTDGSRRNIQTSQGLEMRCRRAFTRHARRFVYHRLSRAHRLPDDVRHATSSSSENSDGTDASTSARGRTLASGCCSVARSTKGSRAGSRTRCRSRRAERTSVVRSLEACRASRPRARRRSATPKWRRDFDRTHVLNVAGAYDLGRNWRAGARFYFYYTGSPYSRPRVRIPDTARTTGAVSQLSTVSTCVREDWQFGRRRSFRVRLRGIERHVARRKRRREVN